MAFRPAGSDHAIVSNSFTLVLNAPIADGAISQLKSRPTPWSSILPALRDAMAIEVVLQADGSPQMKRRAGVEYSFLKPDGTATWSLKVASQEITVDCNLYTRWDRVWAQARALLGQAMTFAGSPSGSSWAAFSMVVVDRFVSDAYVGSAKGVFQDSPLLGSKLRDFDTLWHQHIGWLEPDGAGELLQNLNIDVVPIDVNARDQGKAINLSHLQRVTAASPMSLLDNDDGNAALLDAIAARMHERNKDALARLLTAKMQGAIKLNGERNGRT